MHEMKTHWRYYQISGLEQQKNWADSMKAICSLRTFPELLYTLDQTRSVGLDSLLDLNFFKNGIQPMWEDPSNVNGGRIIMEIPVARKDMLFDIWAKTLVFCALEPFEGVNGCVYAEKANYRVCIWVSDASVSDEIMNAWKHILGCSSAVFTFSLHNKHGDGSKFKKGFTKNKSRF